MCIDIVRSLSVRLEAGAGGLGRGIADQTWKGAQPATAAGGAGGVRRPAANGAKAMAEA